MTKRRLIEDWLPIAALSAEAIRERRIAMAGNVLPPTTYLHVWFARRPLVASRAAILGSLLGSDADRTTFIRTLGIHGNPVQATALIEEARRTGNRIADPHGYPRAWHYTPQPVASGSTVLDPTAGGGSIPLEASRLGCDVFASDLNPVAALLLKATVQLPTDYGSPLLARYQNLSREFLQRLRPRVSEFFGPPSDETYLWARTVTCPYCGGVVPLSPNWRLSSSGQGVRLSPVDRRVHFEIVDREADQSAGTVKDGEGSCPFSECRRGIGGDEIKMQAQTGRMGHQLYAVVYKEERIKGYAKNGKAKTKKIRRFRAPRPDDEVYEQVARRLEEKMPSGRRVTLCLMKKSMRSRTTTARISTTE